MGGKKKVENSAEGRFSYVDQDCAKIGRHKARANSGRRSFEALISKKKNDGAEILLCNITPMLRIYMYMQYYRAIQ